MRQSLKLFVKRVLRIVVFSLGGLLVTVGVLAVVAAVFEIPKTGLGCIPFAAIALFAAGGGIGICLLAPKLPRKSVKFKMMSREERFVENIRIFQKQRSFRIVLFSVFAGVSLVICILTVRQGKKLDATITPQNIRPMASFENADSELPALFCRFYTLAGLKAKLALNGYLFALGAGFWLAMLIIDIAGLNRADLILSMWEKIQQLERDVKESKESPVAGGELAGQDKREKPESGQLVVIGEIAGCQLLCRNDMLSRSLRKEDT